MGIDSDWYNYSDEAGNYEFSFLWNWDGPVAVICEAEGYDTQTATIMPEEEEVELNFILLPSQQEDNGVVFGHVYEISLDPNEVIPISGAVLLFVNSVIGDTWTTLSGENGGYEISLPAGFYQTWVEAEGYQSQDDQDAMTTWASHRSLELHQPATQFYRIDLAYAQKQCNQN